MLVVLLTGLPATGKPINQARPRAIKPPYFSRLMLWLVSCMYLGTYISSLLAVSKRVLKRCIALPKATSSYAYTLVAGEVKLGAFQVEFQHLHLSTYIITTICTHSILQPRSRDHRDTQSPFPLRSRISLPKYLFFSLFVSTAFYYIQYIQNLSNTVIS